MYTNSNDSALTQATLGRLIQFLIIKVASGIICFLFWWAFFYLRGTNLAKLLPILSIKTSFNLLMLNVVPSVIIILITAYIDYLITSYFIFYIDIKRLATSIKGFLLYFVLLYLAVPLGLYAIYFGLMKVIPLLSKHHLKGVDTNKVSLASVILMTAQHNGTIGPVAEVISWLVRIAILYLLIRVQYDLTRFALNKTFYQEEIQ